MIGPATRGVGEKGAIGSTMGTEGLRRGVSNRLGVVRSRVETRGEAEPQAEKRNMLACFDFGRNSNETHRARVRVSFYVLGVFARVLARGEQG